MRLLHTPTLSNNSCKRRTGCIGYLRSHDFTHVMNKRFVLVVDDSSDFLSLVELALEPVAEQHYLGILHATGGEEALALLEQHPSTAALLTDLAMPTMDGLELIRRCRTRYPLLQIVVLSGRSDSGAIIEAIRAGASDYIIKPPTLEELESSLLSALERYSQLERQLQVRDKLEQYERELAIAASIQRQMLPLPLEQNRCRNVSVAALLMPARHVAGDFYDHWLMPDDRLAVCIGDVSGKGISAALLMAMTKTLLRSHIEHGSTLTDALGATNRVLAANNPQAYFVTAIAAIFDPRSGILEMCNAAHADPFCIGADGGIRQLSLPHGMPLGALETSTYQSIQVPLSAGDRVLFYTDGVLDALSGDLAEQDSAWRTVIARALARRGADFPSALIAELSPLWLAEHLPDDVTVLTLEYKQMACASLEEGTPSTPSTKTRPSV
ncbi:MAG: fused response regulator/phosphatase [Candidatus Kapaibacterium sp.]|nr:MAG: fused response regulator/phosphatase [Candidatus Kapabacteria bacterium]